MQKIKGHARFLLDKGLIFEINRKVLHPLGLAFSVEQNPDNARWVNLYLYETRDDDGFLYDDESFKFNNSKYQEFMREEGTAKHLLREKRLGFIVQEGNDDEID